MARLPATAKSAYRTARASAESKGDMIGMHSWFGQWRRYLAYPGRAMLELDMTKLLMQSRAEARNEAQAKQVKRGNLTEAKMLLSGIRYRRINNPELLEMVEKAEQDVERELAQLK